MIWSGKCHLLKRVDTSSTFCADVTQLVANSSDWTRLDSRPQLGLFTGLLTAASPDASNVQRGQHFPTDEKNELFVPRVFILSRLMQLCPVYVACTLHANRTEFTALEDKDREVIRF